MKRRRRTLFVFRRRNTSSSDDTSLFCVLLKNAPIDTITPIKSVSGVDKDKCPESCGYSWDYSYYGYRSQLRNNQCFLESDFLPIFLVAPVLECYLDG